jgi:DNA-binding response OmpR family regulator
MPRILIIDDDKSLRKMLRFRLKDSYEVLDTASPEEGLMLALQHKPDAILVDLMMPGHTGFEVCQTIAALSFTELIPVFVISGAPKTLYKDFCYTLGAKGYFEKPIDFDSLQSRLTAILSNRPVDRRIEPRIRLRLGVKLRGIDQKGEPFEILTSTENVSRHGFACSLNVLLSQNAIVELFLWTRTAHRFAGQARLVWIEWPETALTQTCGFRFVEEPREWIF